MNKKQQLNTQEAEQTRNAHNHKQKGYKNKSI